MKKRNLPILTLFFFSMLIGTLSAQREVTGVVSDTSGELLPGGIRRAKRNGNGRYH